MSHLINITQKTSINKSIINLMSKAKSQNSKVKIRKNEIIVNLENESKYIFYGDTKTLLEIKNKNHSSYNSHNNLKLIKEDTYLINNPLGLKESLNSSIEDIKNVNKKVKIKEVQLTISKRKSRLILNKIN